MLNLTQLQHHERMVDFFVEAVNALWWELRVRVADESEPASGGVSIATAHHRFGVLVVESAGPAAKPPAEALAMIRNGARMLALILENRLQARMLADRNYHLESSVRERTAELEDANRRLRTEVAERMRSEAALRFSEERYRLLVENASEAVLVVQAGRIRFHNPRTEALFGRDSETLSECVFSAFVHPDDAPLIQERMLAVLGGESMDGPFTVRLRGADGNFAFAQGNCVAIDWDGENAVLLFLRDVTAERRLEDRLRLAQKMEAVGTLAGGLAHDFNNQLAPILGYAEMALESAPPDSETAHYLRRVVEGADRARDVVHRILTFSRQRLGRFRPLDLDAVVSEAVAEFQPTLPGGTRIVWESAPESGRVEGDPELLGQAVRHLCRNAVQAVAETGGTVRLTLDRVEDAPVNERESPVLGDGEYLRLLVRDTGPGMSPAVLEKCFEPYFTTRPFGEGDGLGLSVAHGIVRHHGGQIAAASQPGIGTTVSVYLPLHVEPAAEAEIRPAARILLADDDAREREDIRSRLSVLGFSVVAAGDGLSALAAFQRAPQAIDLLIADLNLPGLEGDRLARAVRQFRPKLPVILCASYLDGLETGTGGDAVLIKPISDERLARTVRGLLKRSGHEAFRENEPATASADP